MDHHAYVYEADTIENATLPAAAQTVGVDTEHAHFDRFSIDDARTLKQHAETRPVEHDERHFVLVARSLTPEAQNALLKLFEEPPRGAVFHLVVPQVAVLLPTLRSRVQLVHRRAPATAPLSPEFTHFLSQSYGERLEYIARVTKDKDLDQQELLVRSIEQYAHSNLPATAPLLREVVMVRTYLGSPGASRKMLLESLALALGTH